MDPNQLIEELNKPSPLLAAASASAAASPRHTTNSNQSNSDSAILFLDGTDPFGQTPFAPSPSQSQSSSVSGHQILDQVQRELQFLPTGSESAFVPTGTLSASASPSRNALANQSKGGLLSGSMTTTSSAPDVPTAVTVVPAIVDTDYLIGATDPISLGSPVSVSTLGGGGDSIGGSSLGGPQPSSNKVKYSIWQFDYYAQYFDLSTDIFFRRVLWSFLPLTGDHKGTYIERHIQSNPDLYGPFWIALTLAFTVSICDNIVTYLNQWRGDEAAAAASFEANQHLPLCTTLHPHNPLAFTFEHLHLSMLITFSYVTLAPLLLWSFCQWRACGKLYSFLECLCAYGYSLAAFIPVAVASLLDIRELQFILFACAAFMSGSVLLISFAPVVHSDPSRSIKFSYIMLVFIFVAHFTLALFYLYVFL
ncbi:Yip1 member 1 [Tyrophagus putrescentiae]|nr:Yip1 member 1 [Tyrophagus putrescentiae]